MTERIKLEEKDIIKWNVGKDYGISLEYLKDNSKLGYHALTKKEAEQLKSQILQDHEKAKNWDSIVSISNKYGIVSPLQLAMDYNEIVNRLREYKTYDKRVNDFIQKIMENEK